MHVITPGDHFSPRTGSAIPTVVHGLATAANARGDRPQVVVARGTYPDRYPSADVVEYTERPAGRSDRRIDAVTGRLGLGRPRTRRRYTATVIDQDVWPPSVVFAHNAPQLVGAIDVSRHVPVLYAHNELLRTYSRREAGQALSHAARIVCVSEFLAERTRDRLPPSLHERVVVVRNGVDAALFRPAPEDDPEAGLRVTFVGRMIPAKGADVLVEAVRRLGRSDVSLTLVGSHGFDPSAPPTAFERSVRAAAGTLPGPVAVTPFLPREQVAAALRHTDVLVVPSRWPEPFGLTVLEGMASGAAVVGSAIGGVPEAGGDALLAVPPDDADAVAAELARLADRGPELDRARTAGRQHALTCGWDRSLRELQELVEVVA